MDNFDRRIYRGPIEMIQDLRELISRYGEARLIIQEETLPPAFRERLMLTVTEVNNCRYCSYAHSQMALQEGISKGEIESLRQGMFSDFPEGEIPALLYAQHWAESDGQPDVSAREKVVEEYGEVVVEQIELAMKMIRSANLLGNTFDYIIYRISFGKWNPASFMDKLLASFRK